MIKKYNTQKKAVILPDRSLGKTTSWGVIWTKKEMNFGIVPDSLDESKADKDNCVAELNEHLRTAIKLVDRINELFNISYEPGQPSHIKEIRVRDQRVFVSETREPLFTECWMVISEVDYDFCVIENVVTGDTKLLHKGLLFGCPVDKLSGLALHWTECQVLTSDRIRNAVEIVKQSKKEDSLSEGKVDA